MQASWNSTASLSVGLTSSVKIGVTPSFCGEGSSLRQSSTPTGVAGPLSRQLGGGTVGYGNARGGWHLWTPARVEMRSCCGEYRSSEAGDSHPWRREMP